MNTTIPDHLTVNIGNFVKRLGNINFLQPLYEAVVNSLDADATEISINTSRIKLHKNDKNEEFINGFTIIDNGEGFTDENISSFMDIFHEKRSEGKLGSGRFLYLKIFNNVNIKSLFENKTVLINLSCNYDKIKPQIINEINEKRKTIVELTNLTAYGEKHREKYDIYKLRYELETYLLPKLYELKNKGKSFKISIDGNFIAEITDESIVNLEKQKFQVTYTDKDKNFYQEDFSLLYHIEDNSLSKKDKKAVINNFIVAHNRKVKDFSEDIGINNLPNGVVSIMMVLSKYFDNNVNDERNSLNINNNTPTEAAPIPLSEINKKLKQEVKSVLEKKLPNINDILENNKSDAIKEYPYLTKYIENVDLISADKNKIVKRAKQNFEKDIDNSFDRFAEVLKSKNITDDEYQKLKDEFTELSARELGRYICYRQQIIKYFETLIKNNENYEDKIHDIFCTKHNVDDKYTDVNLWLLDDKYMNYLNIYSDDKIQKIKDDLKINMPKVYGDNNEPDLIAFYNKDTKKKDIVVIEFKGIGVKNKEKLVSYTEINNNSKYVARNFEDVNCIYSYVITSLNENLVKDFEQPYVKLLLTEHKYPILYWYDGDYTRDKNGNIIPRHSFVVDIETIVSDANNRNMLFLNLLKDKDTKK